MSLIPTTPSVPAKYSTQDCLADLQVVAGDPSEEEIGAAAAALVLAVQRRQQTASTRIWSDAVPLWRFRPQTRRGLAAPQ